MLTINKITSSSVIDYAAEELKKYLRMMMPEAGDVKINYNPKAKDGFRLGLMSDFGLDDSDAENKELDDVIYVYSGEKQGIIAGSNPRSVLLSVYEFLRQQGCRWLMPGVDGELIPMIERLVPVRYRHKPSMRYRGFCNEGAEYQQCVLDAIEFIPKVGMNVFMLEFRIPKGYYSNYYNHKYNEENFKREPVGLNQILQWKRQCEAEIAKRGLQFHDIGHGFNADSFGIDSSWRPSDPVDHNTELTEEQISFLALRGGKRALRGNCPNWTQFCMSNPKAQKMFAKAVADYAENHSNEDYLHVALGDGDNGHCECENCKKSPSDYYVDLMNMVDEELTARGLSTRIVFAAYMDTSWAPTEGMIKNQDRFSLLFCPITRDYSTTLSDNPKEGKLTIPYVKNKLTFPKTLEEYFAYLNEWKESGWLGNCISYEYHFWVHQYLDVTGLDVAKVINEDVRVYKENGINGIIEDGSQRSFFPSGLAFYTYARSLYNLNLSAEEIAKEYFEAAYGEGASEILAYMQELSAAIKYKYTQRKLSANQSISPFYNPEEAKCIKQTREITRRGREILKKYFNSDDRVRTVSVRLLWHHADFVDMLSDALYEKALGHDEEADKLINALRIEFGKREPEIEKYYDHFLEFYTQTIYLFNIRSNKEKLNIMGGQ